MFVHRSLWLSQLKWIHSYPSIAYKMWTTILQYATLYRKPKRLHSSQTLSPLIQLSCTNSQQVSFATVAMTHHICFEEFIMFIPNSDFCLMQYSLWGILRNTVLYTTLSFAFLDIIVCFISLEEHDKCLLHIFFYIWLFSPSTSKLLGLLQLSSGNKKSVHTVSLKKFIIQVELARLFYAVKLITTFPSQQISEMQSCIDTAAYLWYPAWQ